MSPRDIKLCFPVTGVQLNKKNSCKGFPQDPHIFGPALLDLQGQAARNVSKIQAMVIVNVFGNHRAFAALTDSGSVVCWGDSEAGGDCYLEMR